MNILLDEILLHQDDPRFDEYRYDDLGPNVAGRLNVAECLEMLGLKVGSPPYAYVVSHYTLPNVDYSRIDFNDFAFNWIDYSNATLCGCKFDDCFFQSAPRELSRIHFVNMEMKHNGFWTGHQFVGSRLTNCTCEGITNANFENAIIESDGRSLGRFFSHQYDAFSGSTFNGALITDQLMPGSIGSRQMNGATIRNSVWLNVILSGEITNTHFINVTVVPPNGNPSFVWAEKHSLLSLSNFRNNTITNCNWQYLQLIGGESVESFHQNFYGNSFVNNFFHCAQMIFNNQNSYEGTRLQQLFVATSNGAVIKNNDFSAQRWGGFPCIDRSRSSAAIKVGVSAMWVGVSIVALSGILYVSKRLVEAFRQRQLRSEFKDLVTGVGITLEILESTLAYQSAMMRVVGSIEYQNEHGRRIVIPPVLCDAILNHLPRLNLNNRALKYRDEIKVHREGIKHRFFNHNRYIENDLAVEEEEEEDVPMLTNEEREYLNL
jgi:uncharacterized protein YjbI with pentapeptide repeats